MTALPTIPPAISASSLPASSERADHLRLSDLWHRYGGAAAGSWTLRGIDLHLAPGELVGLLGPSGCGKTTLLRLIAGFEQPARGEVAIDGRLVAGSGRWLEPERRGVGMVFQDYALFPHLDAWHNACFGLRRGQDPARASWLMDLLGLAGLERRYPHELSGGQRQRLALARALAPGPALVLLDEPFSNLDVEVRLRLRSELPEVLARCGAGGLLVTHDPEEALAICDRVGVLREGVLHQCASPRELVDRPATAFVGRFLLQGNLLPAQRDGEIVSTPLGRLAISGPAGDPPLAAVAGDPPEVMVGDQAVAFEPDPAGAAVVCGREFLGRDWRYRLRLADLPLHLRLPLEVDLASGQRGHLRLRPGESARLFPCGRPLVAL